MAILLSKSTLFKVQTVLSKCDDATIVAVLLHGVGWEIARNEDICEGG
jgi:hypothetical protein